MNKILVFNQFEHGGAFVQTVSTSVMSKLVNYIILILFHKPFLNVLVVADVPPFEIFIKNCIFSLRPMFVALFPPAACTFNARKILRSWSCVFCKGWLILYDF